MSLRSKWAAGPALAGRSEPDWQLAGASLNRYVTDPAAAGQPPAHFQRNPPGPRPVGCFSVRRPPDSLRYGRFATASPARTALKNSQLIRRLPDDVTIIFETVH